MDYKILSKDNLTVSNVTNGFSNYLFGINKSTRTINAYIMDLNIFKEFLNTHLNNKIRYLKDLTLVETEQFKDYLMQLVRLKKFKRNTVYRKFTTLKVLFNYLEASYGFTNILKHDTWGRRSKKADYDHEGDNVLPHILEEEDTSLLFRTIKNSYDKNKFRDYALFALLYATGCRRGDCLMLKWTDINFSRKEIYLYHEKSKTKYGVKMSDFLFNALVQYYKVCPPTSYYIFKSRQSNSLSPSAFNDIIKKWINKSNLATLKHFQITAHTFRHTFITYCIRANMAPEKIITYTGHSDVRSLDIYFNLVPQDLDDVANLFNPVI